ncbi:glycoside hydrolase family 43 protein [Kitasatospora sp. NPDC048365]|uniref:glycoside hydrolase family 43 protein n=1 Tax=Kitasatospora sp. NPDC048365 TaxID=3364050 RepID=UPI00370FFD78
MPYAANPILPGFHPDPSICRVGEDYYLVNSSFQYFPGLPIHHSRDLVHWRPLGHVLDRPGQLPLDGVRPSGGLYAPTIRYAHGRFHVVCTLVDGLRESGTFVVTAEDPAGPWSEPVWLPEAPGFDPDLFVDPATGRTWLLGARPVPGLESEGRTEIWARPIDHGSWRFTGEERVLFRGALVDARWAEGPHLLHRDGWYYLLLAEGGTEELHAVTVARSRSLDEPFENCPRNPLLTHRHLGPGCPVTGVGHADLVDTPGGDWYAVVLGSRPYEGRHTALGRETFLARVGWAEDGWPVVNPGIGRLQQLVRVDLPAHPWPVGAEDPAELGPQWCRVRTPRRRIHRLDPTSGVLRLEAAPVPLSERGSPSFLGRRLQHHRFSATTTLLDPTAPVGTFRAGLALLQDEDHHVLLTVGAGGARATVRCAGHERVLAELPLRPGPVRLAVRVDGPDGVLLTARGEEGWRQLAAFDARVLTTATAGGFTGALVGLYAYGEDGGHADFAGFRYGGDTTHV